MKDDTEYQEVAIDEVTEIENGYEIQRADGWTLWCPKVEGLPAPLAGETMRCYGAGIGSTVRGIVIGGRVYKYKTAEEQEVEHQQWVADQHALREKEMQESLVERDRKIAALPQVFRERIEKFQREGGHEFRRDYETYEVFCCEQAVLIADAFKTPENIIAFHAFDWKEQKAALPALDDGHSGNTFGAACMLARLYVERPEFVTQMHGALAPLVGSDAYKKEQP